MKICLIKIPTFDAPKSLSYFGSVPNLGLAYVAGAIRSAGHQLQVIDAPGEAINQYKIYGSSVGDLRTHGLTKHEIVERIDPDTDVVGLNNMFLHESEFVSDLLTDVKSRLPHATTVIGGEVATSWWNQMLNRCSGLDICAMGEGEEVIKNLLNTIESGHSLRNARSIAFRENNSPIIMPRLGRIKTVDGISWPAWDLFPLNTYLDHEFGSGVNRGRSIPMLTSRGCPFLCTFCSSPEMWTTDYVAREPGKVADEISNYIKLYGVTNINFNDLTSVLTKSWIVDFVREIKSRNLKFSWQLPSGTRSEAIDQEAAELLYESGCRNFCYAPESGSPRILKSIKKKVKIPSLIKSLKGSLNAGLTTHASIIVGYPQEKLKDLWLTYLLLIRFAWHGLHGVSVLMFAPYPGSELYKNLHSNEKITFNSNYIYSTLLRSGASSQSYHPKYPTSFLFSIQWFFLLTFFSLQYMFRPMRIVRIIKNFVQRRQETVMDQFLFAKIKQLRWFARTK
ncbi:MAG: radical SAM protein [Nitrospina sp.]|jgi:anaerobic magnesium-protoporphyrin IX monomethyl ester cyclase|nr:radical SAM protein [Nitrospina sp.]MBT6600608.1 radical SAM protein [Nitrospina sp.]